MKFNIMKMKTDKRAKYHFNNCIKNNIIVYPVNIKNKWFIQINNNGKIITGKKVIGTGMSLSSKRQKDWINTINKTLEYWSKLIDKNKNGINKNN